MSEPHPASAELAYESATGLLARLGAGELSAVEATSQLLDRIESIDPEGSTSELRSIAATSTRAIDEAAASDARRRAGLAPRALEGVPVLIKDNIEAHGLPGLAGSSSLIGRPAREAPIVATMREAGAVILGSTNLSQWANIRSTRSTSGWSATGGLVANPWALDRTAGGSSSGSGAALAAGLAPLALGTETDGSIVCPSSVNGVAGLKPTVGALSRTAIVPISQSQDSPGPMARCVDDLALLLAALRGAGDLSLDGERPRFVDAATWRTGDPATDALVDGVLAELAASGALVVRDVAMAGEAEGRDELTVLLCELVDDLTAYLSTRPGEGVRSLEDVVAHEESHADLEMPYFAHEHFLAALESGGRASESYAPARERNLAWAVSTCLEPALEGADVVVGALYGPAWKADLAYGDRHDGGRAGSTTAAAIAGWPIASVPIGQVDGLPVGLGLVARAGDEAVLLRAARLVEQIVVPRGEFARPSWRAPERG
jgi:amidase